MFACFKDVYRNLRAYIEAGEICFELVYAHNMCILEACIGLVWSGLDWIEWNLQSTSFI